MMAKKKQKTNLRGLTASQDSVFKSFINGDNIFLTGKGGTGKSYLTRYIISWCQRHGRNVLCCAPTGVAANNIGGTTIHKTFKASPGIIEPSNAGKTSRCYDKKKLEIIEKADVVIIDEISMCRIDLWEYVANTLLWCQRRKQLLVVGDFFQLPPPLNSKEAAAFSELYGNKLYAFESDTWAKLNLRTMELQESMRQKDENFISALDNIREGRPDFAVFDTASPPDPEAITICSLNDEAKKENEKQFDSLCHQTGRSDIVFRAIEKGEVSKEDYTGEKELHLCIGARVMMLVNDKDGGYVNGSLGRVADISMAGTVSVLIDGHRAPVIVERYKWSVPEYSIEEDDKGRTKLVIRERGTIEQFPVKLAWATSIHKSQGQTYSKVNVNIKSIFASGQLYVALSRCQTLEGLRIIGQLTPEKVAVSDAVKSFMDRKHDLDPEKSGPDIGFYNSEAHLEAEKYQEGYDEGYDIGYVDGTTDTEEKYKKKIQDDPGVKVLSEYTKRQKELAMIEDPEERNPKGAGRKKLPIHEKADSKAIRVPGVVADKLKEIGEITKKTPDLDSLLEDLENFIEAHQISG